MGSEYDRQTGRFGKDRMLRKHAEFSLLRSKGQTARGFRMLFSWYPSPDSDTRLGLVVSKKYHRGAVQRNRARRLLREAFRLSAQRFKEPVWVVLVARRGMAGASVDSVRRELLFHCYQAQLLRDSQERASG